MPLLISIYACAFLKPDCFSVLKALGIFGLYSSQFTSFAEVIGKPDR
jgi:hypothetical protein